MAQFRPIGISTRFGTSNFQYDPYGNLTSAGYTANPTIARIRDRLLGTAENYNYDISNQLQPLTAGSTSLFNLGGSYLGANPQEVAAKYISDRQSLLQPSRAAEFGRLTARNFATGRGGLGINTGTGGAPSNPALQAYYNSIFQQDKALAAEADQEAMNRIRFGSEVLGSGGRLLGQVPALQTAYLSPLQSQIGLFGGLESLAQTPLDLSAQLAGRTASAGAAAGQIGLLGARAAAPYQVESQSYSPYGQILGASAGPAAGALQTVGGKIGGWFGDLIGLQPTPSQTSTGLYTFD
jgi:YD repeat-containing protein